MKIYPAIDILDDQCVRLEKGDFAKTSFYSTDADELLQNFIANGIRRVHMVDLTRARSPDAPISKTILEMAKKYSSRIEIQVGGGIREMSQIQELLDAGVSRVVIGTLAVKKPELAREIIESFGPQRITIALDMRINVTTREPELATDGWQASITSQTQNFWQVLEFYQELGVKTFLCTDISKDGMLKGPNLEFYRLFMNRYPHLEIQASGGVSCFQDLEELRKIEAPAVIVGKAFYEGRLTLSELTEKAALC